MSNKRSILFRCDGKVTFDLRKGTELMRLGVAATILGSYAVDYFKKYYLKPLLSYYGYSVSDSEAAYHFLLNDCRYDDNSRKTVLKRHPNDILKEPPQSIIVDYPTVHASRALRRCYPKPGLKSPYSIYGMCRDVMHEYFPASTGGNSMLIVDNAILIAIEQMIASLSPLLGKDVTSYLKTEMEIENAFSSYHPKSRFDLRIKYDAPLQFQKDIMSGSSNIKTSLDGTDVALEDAVALTLGRLISRSDDISPEGGNDRVYEKLDVVSDHLRALAKILSSMTIDENEIIISIKRPTPSGNKSLIMDRPPHSDDDRSEIGQYERIMRTPRICMDCNSDLERLYVEPVTGFIGTIVNSILSDQSLFIMGDVGTGKSSALLMAYSKLHSIVTDRRVLVVDTGRLAERIKTHNYDGRIPLMYSDFITPEDRDIFLMDSLDEHFQQDAIDLSSFLNSLSGQTILMAGRPVIARNLSLRYRIMTLDVPEPDKSFKDKMIKAYGSDPMLYTSPHINTVNPLLLALICRNGNISENQRLTLYQTASINILTDKISSIPSGVGTDGAMSIISEYAWSLFKNRSPSYDIKVDVAKEMQQPLEEMNDIIGIFTDSDGWFIHQSFFDYFISYWIRRHALIGEPRKDLLYRMLTPSIQEFIREDLSNDPSYQKRLFSWYNRHLSNLTDSYEDGVKQAIIHSYIYRILITDQSETNTSRRIRSLIESGYTAQAGDHLHPDTMVFSNALIQTGRMDVESNYYRLLQDGDFSRMVRSCFLVYAGDIDIADYGEYEQTWSDARLTIDMILHTIMSEKDRHIFLTRTDSTIARQLIEMGYPINQTQLQTISSLDIELIMERISDNSKLKQSLSKYHIDYKEYLESTNRELQLLTSMSSIIVNKRIESHSLENVSNNK